MTVVTTVVCLFDKLSFNDASGQTVLTANLLLASSFRVQPYKVSFKAAFSFLSSKFTKHVLVAAYLTSRWSLALQVQVVRAASREAEMEDSAKGKMISLCYIQAKPLLVCQA